MRGSRTRVIGALVAGGFVISLAAGQAAVGAPVAGGAQDAPPIGGPQLASGLAVNLAPGIKPLPAMLAPKAWLVADLDTGQVLGAYDPHAQHRPASTLKTLAALALIPTINPSAQIPFTADELSLTSQKDGRTTLLGLVPGQSYPAKRLFEAMLSLSANDATEALAAAAPGGRVATLASMNAIATTLQAHDTHAATPDGLDGPGQEISAYDLALIARAAIAVPGFTEYNTVPVVHVPSNGRPLSGGNHDRLQNSLDLLNGATVIAGKDGYTTDSGQVWWGAAEKDGHRIIVTEMDAGFEPVTTEISLLNWGFAVDGKIAPAGNLVAPLTAAGVPEPLTAVTKRVPAAPATVKRSAAAHTSSRGSGIWEWILAFLFVLAAAALGRRHFLAARPAAGQSSRLTGPKPVGRRGPSAVPVPAANPLPELALTLAAEHADLTVRPPEHTTSVAGKPGSASRPQSASPAAPQRRRGPEQRRREQTPRSGQTRATESTPDPTPAPTHPPELARAAEQDRDSRQQPRPTSLKPWQAPVSDHSVILRSSSALNREPGAPVGRRVDGTLDTKLETWRAARAEPDSAERARAERLRTGAVKIIPAPAPVSDEEATPRNRG